MKYLDLHRHLDGSITPAIARALAQRQNLPLPENPEAALRVRPDCRNLNDFLTCFALPLTLMQTEEGICEAVRLVCADAAKEGNVYAELRFAPQLHTEKGLSQENVIRAALRGLEDSPIPANLLLCCMRGQGNDAQNAETLALAERLLTEDGGVTGMDLAGAEGLFPTKNYRALLGEASRKKIPLTVHAGEADGAESVREAILAGARRIGHGIRVAESEEAVREARESGVAFEVCPTSNRQTCALPDMALYPLRRMMDAGLRVTLNTDDPAIEGTDIAEEYAYATALCALGAEEKKRILTDSVEASFTSQSRKRDILSKIGIIGK